MSLSYAELRCRSHFSFLTGASEPRELVERAAALGYRALAITDQDGLHGVVRALGPAEELGLPLLIGSHITVGERPWLTKPTRPVSLAHASVPLVLFAQNRNGYSNLCRLVSRGRTLAPKGSSLVTAAEVAEHSADLIALYVGPADLCAMQAWRDVFGDRLYAATWRHLVPGEERRNRGIEAIGRGLGIPRVAVGDVHTHHARRQPLQDVLTCIRLGTTLEQAGDRLLPNGERTLRSLDQLAALYSDHPEWLARSVEVAERCRFSMRELRYAFPEELIPPHHTPMTYLRELTDTGLAHRYCGDPPAAVRAQVEHELRLIEELDFSGFFLTVWDIVRYARSAGILCQGRGSAANSAVCYALGVTAIDPVRMELLFERFVSVERGEPPDIDVDFEHERREEVLQYVYEKYGRQHAAMVCEVVCYRGRLALREVGKVLGLSLDQVDRLAKAIGWGGAAMADEALLQEVGLDAEDSTVRQVLRLAQDLEGTPRHLSIHVGGFVITREPVWHLVPVENASMADRTVVQWDKDDIDTLGILKVDLLGLGMLTCIRKAFEFTAAHEGTELTLDTLPLEDALVYDHLCEGDSLGVFQVESRAQMGMLPRLRPRSFYDLVVQVAIVRPGPIQGDMVHPYLRRRQGEETVAFPHDKVQQILGRTYGVPLFQEQVMKLAVVAGGFTPGEADQLRRAMGAWRRRGQITEMAERLISGLIKNGVTPEYAQRIFEQIHGFGEYGFPESHAASFALLVYASAYLRVHHRAAFSAALLNSQPMGFYAPHSIVADAQRDGVPVLPVHVLRSDWDCTLERMPAERDDLDGLPPIAIRLGFRVVRGMKRDAVDRLLALRALQPPRSLTDVARKAQVPADQMIRLASAHAFAPFGLERREAVWRVQALPAFDLPLLAMLDDESGDDAQMLPQATEREEMLGDYDAMSLSLGYHPVGLVRAELRARGILSAQELLAAPTQQRVTVAGMAIVRQRPETAKGVLFITLEDETGQTNIVVWPKVYERHRRVARDEMLLEIDGTIQREAGVVNVVALSIRRMRWGSAPTARSRDFR